MTTISNLTAEMINEVLESKYIGRIGCSENGRTYVVPITYYYDKSHNSILGVTTEGMKVKMLRKNPEVCFEVEEIENMTNWRTVIAWGKYEELSGSDAKRALHVFVEGIKSLIHANKDSSPAFLKDFSSVDSFNHHTIIFRIPLSEKTGKSESSA